MDVQSNHNLNNHTLHNKNPSSNPESNNNHPSAMGKLGRAVSALLSSIWSAITFVANQPAWLFNYLFYNGGDMRTASSENQTNLSRANPVDTEHLNSSAKPLLDETESLVGAEAIESAANDEEVTSSVEDPLPPELEQLQTLLNRPPQRLNHETIPPSSTALIEQCNLLQTAITSLIEEMEGPDGAEGVENTGTREIAELLSHIQSLLGEKQAALSAATHTIRSTTPPTAPTDGEEFIKDARPQQLAARRSAAAALATVKNALQQLGAVNMLEEASVKHQDLVKPALQNFMKTRMAEGKLASDALSQIQGDRFNLYQDHFKNWDKVWSWAHTMPEVRRAAESLGESALNSPTALTGKILALLDEGASDQPSKIPTKNSVTHIIETLESPRWIKLFEHHKGCPELGLKVVAHDLRNLINGEAGDLNLKNMKDLNTYILLIRDEIKDNIPENWSGLRKPLSYISSTPSKIEKQTLLREIDNIRSRLTLGHEIAVLSQKLGGLSIPDTLNRIYQLHPYVTSLEAVGNILGPVSEQRSNLDGWQAQLIPMAQAGTLPEEENRESNDYTVQWLKGAIHELATQQANDQANKTAQQITTLDAINSAKTLINHPDKIFEVSEEIAEANYYKQIDTDLTNRTLDATPTRWNFQVTHQEVNRDHNLLNQASARPLQKLLSTTPQSLNGLDQEGNIVDRLAATVETPEGKLPAFDAALWGYLDNCYPGELSGEHVDIDLLEGARGYEAAKARFEAFQKNHVNGNENDNNENNINENDSKENQGVRDNVIAATGSDWLRWIKEDILFVPNSILPSTSTMGRIKQNITGIAIPLAAFAASSSYAANNTYVNESFNHLGNTIVDLAAAGGAIAGVLLATSGTFLAGQVVEDKVTKLLWGRSRPDTLNTKPTDIVPPHLTFSAQEEEAADGIPEQANWRANLKVESDTAPMADITNRWVNLLANEVETNHHQMNHAFETYSKDAPAFKQFKKALMGSAPEMGIEIKSSIAEIAQQGLFSDAIERIVAEAESGSLPQAQLQPIVKEVIHLAEHRNFRNIANFIARAERDERPLNSSEREMIKLWANQLVDLYEQYAEIGGTDLTTGSDFTLLRDRIERSDHALNHLVEIFKEADHHTPKPDVKVDPNIAKERPKEWQEKFRSAIKSWADPFKFEVEHGDRIKSGRAIINCNHGLQTVDMGWLVDSVREISGNDVRMVIDRNLSRIPGVGWVLDATGFHEGNPHLFQGLLASEKVVAVAPGGMEEALQPPSNRNGLRSDRRLQHNGSEKGPSQGYIKDHITTAAPIHTALTPRADDINHAPDNMLARAAYDNLRAPVGMVKMHKVRLNKVNNYVSEPIPAPILPVSNASIKSREMSRTIDAQHRSVTDRASAQLIASDITMPFKRLPSQQATA